MLELDTTYQNEFIERQFHILKDALAMYLEITERHKSHTKEDGVNEIKRRFNTAGP